MDNTSNDATRHFTGETAEGADERAVTTWYSCETLRYLLHTADNQAGLSDEEADEKRAVVRQTMLDMTKDPAYQRLEKRRPSEKIQPTRVLEEEKETTLRLSSPIPLKRFNPLAPTEIKANPQRIPPSVDAPMLESKNPPFNTMPHYNECRILTQMWLQAGQKGNKSLKAALALNPTSSQASAIRYYRYAELLRHSFDEKKAADEKNHTLMIEATLKQWTSSPRIFSGAYDPIAYQAKMWKGKPLSTLLFKTRCTLKKDRYANLSYLRQFLTDTCFTHTQRRDKLKKLSLDLMWIFYVGSWERLLPSLKDYGLDKKPAEAHPIQPENHPDYPIRDVVLHRICHDIGGVAHTLKDSDEALRLYGSLPKHYVEKFKLLSKHQAVFVLFRQLQTAYETLSHLLHAPEWMSWGEIREINTWRDHLQRLADTLTDYQYFYVIDYQRYKASFSFRQFQVCVDHYEMLLDHLFLKDRVMRPPQKPLHDDQLKFKARLLQALTQLKDTLVEQQAALLSKQCRYTRGYTEEKYFKDAIGEIAADYLAAAVIKTGYVAYYDPHRDMIGLAISAIEAIPGIGNTLGSLARVTHLSVKVLSQTEKICKVINLTTDIIGKGLKSYEVLQRIRYGLGLDKDHFKNRLQRLAENLGLDTGAPERIQAIMQALYERYKVQIKAGQCVRLSNEAVIRFARVIKRHIMDYLMRYKVEAHERDQLDEYLLLWCRYCPPVINNVYLSSFKPFNNSKRGAYAADVLSKPGLKFELRRDNGLTEVMVVKTRYKEKKTGWVEDQAPGRFGYVPGTPLEAEKLNACLAQADEDAKEEKEATPPACLKHPLLQLFEFTDDSVKQCLALCKKIGVRRVTAPFPFFKSTRDYVMAHEIKFTELEQERQITQKRLDRSEQENQKLREDNQALREDNQTLREDNQALREDNQVFKRDNQILKTRFDQSEKEKQILEARFNKSEKEKQILKENQNKIIDRVNKLELKPRSSPH